MTRNPKPHQIEIHFAPPKKQIRFPCNYHTVDGQDPAPPKKPGRIRFPCFYQQPLWFQPWFYFVVRDGFRNHPQGRGIIFEHRFWIIFEHRCPGSFSNTEWVIFEHMGYPAAPVGWGGVGWGSCVRLLLRDRATASWGWGWGRGGAVTFASYCVTVRLRPRAGGRGQPGGSESQVTLDFLKLRCPRRLALVGPRKVVKTRPNGRNTSCGKLKGPYYSVKKPCKLVKFQALSYLVLATQKNILSSYGQSNL